MILFDISKQGAVYFLPSIVLNLLIPSSIVLICVFKLFTSSRTSVNIFTHSAMSQHTHCGDFDCIEEQHSRLSIACSQIVCFQCPCSTFST